MGRVFGISLIAFGLLQFVYGAKGPTLIDEKALTPRAAAG
jgi:hypothetical protein